MGVGLNGSDTAVSQHIEVVETQHFGWGLGSSKCLMVLQSYGMP